MNRCTAIQCCRSHAVGLVVFMTLVSTTGCDRQSAEVPPAVAADQPPSSTAQTRTKGMLEVEADAVSALAPGETYIHSDGVRSIISNDGAYRVAYYFAADADASAKPIIPPVNEPFHIPVIIFARDGSAPTVLAVDAAMPEHGHGMNVSPMVSMERPGRYSVANMLFHMSGRWEIYFDITRDGVTSRAQDEITLE